MAKTFSYEGHLVLTLDLIDEDFIGLGAECNQSSGWTDLNCLNFIWIIDLCNWLLLIAIPEVDWCTLSTCHEFMFIIFSLCHAVKRSIGSGMSVDSLLQFQIIS